MSEVTDINKQKFLAELGRLLTFMYEEDRQEALALYERMFDDCEDEQGLLQHLLSPTRQAVLLARSYNAEERRLSVQAQSGEDEPAQENGLPDYILAIDRVYQDAEAAGLMGERAGAAPVLENQLSLFADDALPFFEEEQPSFVQAAPMVEDEPVSPAELPEEPREEAVEESYHPEPQDAVDAFLADFSIDAAQLMPEASEEAPCEAEEARIPEEQAPADAAEALDTVIKETQPVNVELRDDIPVPEETAPVPENVSTAPVRKLQPFLLIVYILLAVPLTLAGLALLLVPTLLVLALALVVTVAGSSAFVAAFSGFAVFADLMVVLGTALVVSALGLLLLWLFVWFVGGAMVGLVQNVIHLGGRCCYKEVAVS